ADVPDVDDGHAAGGRFESAGWRTGRHQARAWRPRKSRGTAGEAVAGSLRDAARTEFVGVADIDVGIGFAVAGIHVRRAEIGGGDLLSDVRLADIGELAGGSLGDVRARVRLGGVDVLAARRVWGIRLLDRASLAEVDVAEGIRAPDARGADGRGADVGPHHCASASTERACTAERAHAAAERAHAAAERACAAERAHAAAERAHAAAEGACTPERPQAPAERPHP